MEIGFIFATSDFKGDWSWTHLHLFVISYYFLKSTIIFYIETHVTYI